MSLFYTVLISGLFLAYFVSLIVETEIRTHAHRDRIRNWWRQGAVTVLCSTYIFINFGVWGNTKPAQEPYPGANQLLSGSGQQQAVTNQALSSGPRLTTNQYAAGFALVRGYTNSVPAWLTAPSNAVVHAPWTRYGVAEDTFWLPTNGWAFILGTNAVDGVHVSSSGVLSFGGPKGSPRAALLPDGTDMNFLAPLQADLGTVPPGGRFWHAVTPSNSLLCTWQDVFAGRGSNSVVSFQAELFWNGDFAYRYAFTAAPALTNFAVGAQNRGGGETYALNATNLLADGLELRWRAFGLLDPGVDDHDGDGLPTYDEVILYGTSPSLKDTDHDGLEDAAELAAGTDPVNPDTDGDGLADGVDPQPTVWNDSAAEVLGSGMTYGEVILNGLDPATNWALHSDYDGWPDWKEVLAGTATNEYDSSPQNADWSFKLFEATITLGADLPCPAVLNVGGYTLVLQKAGSWKLILKEGVAYSLALTAARPCTVALSCSLDSHYAALQPANGVFSGGAAVPGGAQVACGVIAQPTLRIHPDTVCFHSGSPESVSVEVVPDMAGACVWEWTGGPVSAPSARHTNIAWDNGADSMCVYFTAAGASSARQSVWNVTRCLRTEAADWCDSHDCEHAFCACDSGADPEAWCGFHGQPVSKCGESRCGHHNCPYTACPDDGWCHAHNQELAFCTHAWYTPSEPPGGGGETNGERRVYGRGEDMTVAVNNDDDDADQTSDAEDGEVAGGDDDLAELWPAGGVFGLCCPCPAHRAESVMSAALVSGTGNLALYGDAAKAAAFEGSVQSGQPVYVEGTGASPSPWADRLLWSWTDADNNVHYVTNRVTVLGVRLFGDMDLDGDVDAADRALRPAATNAWGWSMPAATNVFRPVRLRTDVGLSGGRYTLALTGDAGAFRVWPDASGTNAAPLLLCGQTVTNGENGVTFLAAADTDLYVEAVSNGTATLTYAYTGTGDAAGISCAASMKITAFSALFVEDSETRYNFSPSLGETGTVKVAILPLPPESGIPGHHFKIEIVREIQNGGDQHVDWLDVKGDNTYGRSRGINFGEMAFNWEGVPVAPFGSAASQALGKDVFIGVAASTNCLFPEVTLNQPVPPPFYTAIASIRRDNDGTAVVAARKRVCVPQIVKMMYDTASVDAILAGYFTGSGETMIQTIPTNQWPAYRAQIATRAQAYYSAENVNLRFVDATVPVTQPYTVMLMYGEDSLWIDGSYVLGVVSGALDEMNANPSQTGMLFYRSFMASVRDIVISNAFNNLPAPAPVTPDETVKMWAHVAAHETGHTLGLVSHELLGGDASGNHNQFPFNSHLMDPGGESSLYNKMGRDGVVWSFKSLNADYLRFILPKQ